MEAKQTPLIELLERVPQDARCRVDEPDGMGSVFIPVGRLCHEAANALRAALAEPEQEPVAWVLVTPYGEEDDIFYTEPETVPDGWSYKPLYDTAPTPRKPLTPEQLTKIELGLRVYADNDRYDLSLHDFARAIERAHGIGEED